MRENKENPPGPEKNTLPGPIHLLLVDDEQGYVDVLSNRFSRRNIIVTKAYSGREGIQALDRQVFDVAVLDLKMQDLDGIETLKVFKQTAPEMAVIMLTGHGSAEAARQGIKLGADAYLTKPCDFEELLVKIRAAYSKRDKAAKD